MGIQVVIRPVGKPNSLDPAEAVGEDLCIPAVGGIMGPLVREVLAEPEPFRLDPDRDQQFVGEGNVVGEILVCDNALCLRLPASRGLLGPRTSAAGRKVRSGIR
jgi:hypothetical protein